MIVVEKVATVNLLFLFLYICSCRSEKVSQEQVLLAGPLCFTNCTCLAGKSLTCSDLAFTNLPLLEYAPRTDYEVYFNYNNITSIQRDKLVNANISVVFLEHNAIRDIDASAFSKLKNLKTLSLSHNKLPVIQNDLFQNNRLLETVNLSHNPIIYVADSAFGKAANLRNLNLGDCDLDTLSFIIAPSFLVPYDSLKLNTDRNENIGKIDPVTALALGRLNLWEFKLDDNVRIACECFKENVSIPVKNCREYITDVKNWREYLWICNITIPRSKTYFNYVPSSSSSAELDEYAKEYMIRAPSWRKPAAIPEYVLRRYRDYRNKLKKIRIASVVNITILSFLAFVIFTIVVVRIVLYKRKKQNGTRAKS